MDIETLVFGAVVGQAVSYVVKTPRRVLTARVTVMRANHDWQMHREFLSRRREAELYALGQSDEIAAQHVRDRFDDEADASRLRFERQGADALRSLGLVDRFWWRASNWWDRTSEREQELDWAARAVRGSVGDLADEDPH